MFPLCYQIYHITWKRKVMISYYVFRLNQMNVWVPFTVHIPLKVLLVRKDLSLLWWRMNQRMTHSVNRVSVYQMAKFHQGKYRNVLHNILKTWQLTCVLYLKYYHCFINVILMYMYNMQEKAPVLCLGVYLK
jgi:hypothetical protein